LMFTVRNTVNLAMWAGTPFCSNHNVISKHTSVNNASHWSTW
jgi:hypothetical protein